MRKAPGQSVPFTDMVVVPTTISPANPKQHSMANVEGAPNDQIKQHYANLHHAKGNQNSSTPSQPSSRLGNGMNGSMLEGNNKLPLMTHPAPLFERLVSEEAQQQKTYSRLVENLNRRIASLELAQKDTEERLKAESENKFKLEKTLEERANHWSLKLQKLGEERDQLKKAVLNEQATNSKLRDQVKRKDQDIQKMLQRKYDKKESQIALPMRGGRFAVGSQPPTDLTQRAARSFKSPHEILAASGSMERVRQREAENLLMDFFAL